MNDHIIKYLPVSPHDDKIGISIVNAGRNRIIEQDDYPYRGHPTSYKFKWREGRVLDEYQINYIVDGAGIFQSESIPQTQVMPGTAFIVFPGEWHRYRPDIDSGWDEYWVGFRGLFIDQLCDNGIITPQQALHQTGYNEKLLEVYLELIEQVTDEIPGYQITCSGLVLKIIGLINQGNWKVMNRSMHDENEPYIQRAKKLLSQNFQLLKDIETVASEVGMGYSRFRKVFKKYTGFAPGQYQMQQRLLRAKDYLLNTSMSVKEIAYLLGFDSNAHFSKIFKQKTGYSPDNFRKRRLNR